jgi:hypothetical protein
VGSRAGLDTVVKRKNSHICRQSNHIRPARNLVTILTELRRLLLLLTTTTTITTTTTTTITTTTATAAAAAAAAAAPIIIIIIKYSARVQIPVMEFGFFPHYYVQKGSGAHAVSCIVVIEHPVSPG